MAAVLLSFKIYDEKGKIVIEDNWGILHVAIEEKVRKKDPSEIFVIQKFFLNKSGTNFYPGFFKFESWFFLKLKFNFKA